MLTQLADRLISYITCSSDRYTLMLLFSVLPGISSKLDYIIHSQVEGSVERHTYSHYIDKIERMNEFNWNTAANSRFISSERINKRWFLYQSPWTISYIKSKLTQNLRFLVPRTIFSVHLPMDFMISSNWIKEILWFYDRVKCK